MTFLDSATRWLEVGLLAAKSDTVAAFKEFEALLENQSKTGNEI